MEISNKIDLEGAKAYLESIGMHVFYIAVYGSQNYGLDHDGSDVDYKAITLPSLDDLVWERKPRSGIYQYGSGQIDVKDIRAYVESAVKCNINFIEILNTPYFIGDESIREFFLPLQREMWQFYLRACYGMILEKHKALRHPYPSIVHKIEKFWYDPKQLHHIARLHILMKRYVMGDIGNYMHADHEKERLLRMKLWSEANKDVDELADLLIEDARKIRDSYTVEPLFNAKCGMIEYARRVVKNHIIND